MNKKRRSNGCAAPQKHDYLAAESYLSLTFEPQAAKNIVETLEPAETTEFGAKDIQSFRTAASYRPR